MSIEKDYTSRSPIDVMPRVFLADGDLLRITAVGYANFYKKILTHKKAVSDPNSDIPEYYTLYLKTLLNSQSQHAMKMASNFVTEMNSVSDRFIGEAYKFDDVAFEKSYNVIFLSSIASTVNVFLALTGAMDKIINDKFDENELTSYLAMTDRDLKVISNSLSERIEKCVDKEYVEQAAEVLNAMNIVYDKLFGLDSMPASQLMLDIKTQLSRISSLYRDIREALKDK